MCVWTCLCIYIHTHIYACMYMCISIYRVHHGQINTNFLSNPSTGMSTFHFISFSFQNLLRPFITGVEHPREYGWPTWSHSGRKMVFPPRGDINCQSLLFRTWVWGAFSTSRLECWLEFQSSSANLSSVLCSVRFTYTSRLNCYKLCTVIMFSEIYK